MSARGGKSGPWTLLVLMGKSIAVEMLYMIEKSILNILNGHLLKFRSD